MTKRLKFFFFLFLLMSFSCGGSKEESSEQQATTYSKEIKSFKIGAYPALIEDSEIKVYVPYQTDISNLTPTIIHNGKDIVPESGQAQDFSTPINYKVIAKDGSTKLYKVTVFVASSSDKDIVGFSFDGIPNAITNISGQNITVLVPYGTDTSSLVPVVWHNGKTVNPASNLVQNFVNSVQYTVKAFDDSSKTYTVSVNIAPKIKYHGNSNVSGAPPIETTLYLSGSDVVVRDNTGLLEKTNYTFHGWNTQPDGNGVTYQPGDVINLGNSGIDLYANWYGSTGILDTSLNIGSGFNDKITALAVDSKSRIIVGGLFSEYNGVPVKGLLRLNPDGSIDDTFNIGSGFSQATTPFSIVVDSINRIIVGGDFTSYNGQNVGRLMRLKENGNIDTSFNSGGVGFNNVVYALKLDNQENIFVGGTFISYNGTTVNRVAKLTSNGTLDSSFSVGTGPNLLVKCLDISSDGHLIVGGSFTLFNGVSKKNIAKLSSNGSLDNSFNAGAGFNNMVNTLSILPSLQILVGGAFTTYDSITSRRITLLRGSGLIDSSFNSGGYGLSGSAANSLVVDVDGKAVIGGSFPSYNNGTVNNIIRLMNDNEGTKDTTFATGTGFNGEVTALAIDASGRVLAVGAFGTYNNQVANKIVRLR